MASGSYTPKRQVIDPAVAMSSHGYWLRQIIWIAFASFTAMLAVWCTGGVLPAQCQQIIYLNWKRHDLAKSNLDPLILGEVACGAPKGSVATQNPN
jgi:hypothetical protein